MKLFFKILNIILSILGGLTLVGIFVLFIIFVSPETLENKAVEIIKTKNHKKIKKLHLDKIKVENSSNILDEACKTNDIDIIDIILSKLKEVPDDFIISISKYDTKIIDFLLSKDIDINTIKRHEISDGIFQIETPLIYACSFTFLSKIKYLTSKGAKIDIGYPLHTAARYGNIDVVKFLIGNNIDINQKNEKGETPIMTCLLSTGPHSGVTNGKLRVFEYLLDNKADYNIKNNNGENLFHYAVFSNIYIIDKLLKLGLDINQKDNNGFYALHKIDNPHDFDEDIYEYMIEKGAIKIKIGDW